jgi:ADYC domain
MTNRRLLATISAPLLTCAWLVGGCISPPEPTSFVSTAVQGMEEQGRFLLGTTLDAEPGRTSLEHASLSVAVASAAGVATTVSVSRAAVLTTPFKGGLAGLVFTSDSGGRIRIDTVSATATITKVHLQKQVGGVWVDGACGAGLALPLSGVFQRDGLHVADATRLTFACDGDGVAAKCITWGFPPGPSAGAIWDQHQACTRMARADTCSNGVPHTRRETKISFFDIVPGNDIPDALTDLTVDPVASWPPPAGGYYFEAMWRAGSSAAKCLSKMRWQALPVGAACGGALPDPREAVADTCEATSVQDAIDRGGVILFNKSQYNDLAMGLWYAERPNGARDYVTTVRGYHGGLRDLTVHPFHETDGDIYQFVKLDAFLMRVPPGGLQPSDYAAVATYKKLSTGSRVLARKTDPRFTPANGYTLEYDEGYVLNAPRPGGDAALVLYRNATTDDYVASAVGPPTPSYASQGVIGYLTAPEVKW